MLRGLVRGRFGVEGAWSFVWEGWISVWFGLSGWLERGSGEVVGGDAALRRCSNEENTTTSLSGLQARQFHFFCFLGPFSSIFLFPPSRITTDD